jgi:hypothetical protein
MAREILPDEVKAWLRLDDTDDDLVAAVTAAVNSWATNVPYLVAAGDGDWPTDGRQGLVMLAARLYRRRNTPGGVEALGADVVYVPRRDADVTAMLHLARPAVG